jgi:CrcB protein
MRTTLAIAVAGALGVLARHAVQQAVPRPGDLPWGTFVVNISGAFAIGLLATLVARRIDVPMWLQEAVLVGFLGGFTTFSALALETHTMIDRDRLVLAAAYSLGTLVVGLGAVVAGIRLARLLG